LDRKVDRRVVKTKRAIREAFIALMVEKDVEKITIKEIAEKADVDRKTVYNYYSGIHEIREDLENEVLHIFERETQDSSLGLTDADSAFDLLTKIINDNMQICSQLMRLDYNSNFLVKLIEYFKQKIRQEMIKNERFDPNRIDIAVEYVTSGLFSAYRYWFNSDRTQPLEEFSREVSRLVLSGLIVYMISI